MKILVEQLPLYSTPVTRQQFVQVKLNGECLHNGFTHADTMYIEHPELGIYEHSDVPVLVCDFCYARIDTHDDELDDRGFYA